MKCNAPTCWCHADLNLRWIPSMDVYYTVDELPSRDNGTLPDNVRVFLYRYITKEQHGEA